jgi:hypothetical protein
MNKQYAQTARRWRLLIVASVLVASSAVQARPVSESDARAAAETWVRHVTAEARPDASAERVDAVKQNDQTVAYVVHFNGGGFCICGADDVLLPVYAYAPAGEYDDEHPAHRSIVKEMYTRLQLLEMEIKDGDNRHAGMMTERSLLWRGLIAGDPSVALTPPEAQADPAQLVLPLTSVWGQGPPFSNACPTLPPISANHCVTGCNATAGAQLMYYWKWPWQGVGSASLIYPYRWRANWDSTALATDPGIDPTWNGLLEYNSGGGGWLRINGFWDQSIHGAAEGISDDAGYQGALATLYGRMFLDTTFHTANFGASTYDWNLMQDVYPGSPAAEAEVAKLMSHVGIGIGTDYGVWGTWGVFEGYDPAYRDLVQALRDFFRYDPDLLPGYGRGLTQQAAFIEEMQWLRPVAFGGGDTASGGGHAWVLCGYNTTTSPTEFKMNYGWANVADILWSTLDTCKFADTNDHIIRIAPRDVVKFVGSATSGDGSPAEPYQNIEAAVASVPDGATLIFKAGSVNTYTSPTLAITRPLILKGQNIAIMKQ